MIKNYFILFLLLITAKLYTQDIDPYDIINDLKAQLDNIEDYSADIEIEVDVEFIKMPIKHATIYFKKPDKVKFKSKEFMMLPKRGINNQFTEILNQAYTAFYVGSEIIGDQEQHKIKIIPLSDKPDIILATWWINTKSKLITRLESNTRNEGTYFVDFIYDNKTISLPTELVVTFEIEKMKLPLKFIGKSAGMEIDKSKMEDKQNGKVYIRFSNYNINSKIDDHFFEEEDEINYKY